MAISLTSTLLLRAGFAHGFSTRDIGPALTARGVADDGADGLARFAKDAGIPLPIAQLKQVHGARVARAADAVAAIRDASVPLLEGDALVAHAREPAVGVRVADCVPVLVADRATGAVAAIHAGWRGVVAGVIGAAMRELHARDAVAAIGPSIGSCCFEVGADVAATIDDAAVRAGAGRGAGAGAGAAVIVRREGAKAFVDLRAVVRAQLRAEGIADDAIDDVPGCTRCDPEQRFFSFRRDGSAGRQLAAIAPRD